MEKEPTASVPLTRMEWQTVVEALDILAENYRRASLDAAHIHAASIAETIKRLALR